MSLSIRSFIEMCPGFPDKTLVKAVEGLKRLGFNPTLMASERSNLLLLYPL